MSNLTENGQVWPGPVYQLETTDPVLGGPGGISNEQAQNLANRTAFLKRLYDLLQQTGAILTGTGVLFADSSLTASALGKLYTVANSAEAASREPVSGGGVTSGEVPAAPTTPVLITLPATGVPVGAAVGFYVASSTTRAVQVKTPTTAGNIVQGLNADSFINLQAGDRVVLLNTAANSWVLLIDNRRANAFPPGAITAYAGGVVPSGWLECAGQNLTRANYPELFAVVGTRYAKPNVTNPAGEFTLPDLRGSFPRGLDRGRGIDSEGSGRVLGSTQTSAVQAHSHYYDTTGGVDEPGGYNVATGGVKLESNTASTYNTPGGGSGLPAGMTATDTRPHNVAVLYIIRTGVVISEGKQGTGGVESGGVSGGGLSSSN